MTSDPRDIEAHQGIPNLLSGPAGFRLQEGAGSQGAGEGVVNSHLLGALQVAGKCQWPPHLRQALPSLTHLPKHTVSELRGSGLWDGAGVPGWASENEPCGASGSGCGPAPAPPQSHPQSRPRPRPRLKSAWLAASR